jgi:TonB family protein
MYFDFDDYRPDITPVGRAISWREGVLLSIIVHLAGVIVLLAFPQILQNTYNPVKAVPVAEQPPHEQAPTFVFVQPRLTHPRRSRLAAKHRTSIALRGRQNARRTGQSAAVFRGTRWTRAGRREPRERTGTCSGSAAGQQAQNARPQPEQTQPLRIRVLGCSSPARSRSRRQRRRWPCSNAGRWTWRRAEKPQRFTQAFDNTQGGGGQFGPEIQFDTKGVEFGPWIRRFIAQIKRNWFVPYAVMSLSGHVVIQFNVHKDGSITDLTVAGPCPVDAFNNAAFGALAGSNPTQPLPPEYPSEKAFFTVTFFYNEAPQ